MTIRTALALLCLSIQSSFGQKIETQIVNKGIPNIKVFEPVDYNTGSMYYSRSYMFKIHNQVISISVRGTVLDKSIDLRLSNTEDGKTLDFIEKNLESRGLYIETIKQLDDVLYAFYSEYDNLNNQETLNAFVITTENDKLIFDDKQKLIVVDGKVNSDAVYSLGMVNHTVKGKFHVVENENFGKFIVQFTPKRAVESKFKSRDDIGFCVFDNTLTKVHETISELRKSFLFIIDYTVDKDNNVIALIKEEAVSKGPNQDRFDLAKITPEGVFSSQQIALDHYIVDVKLAYDVNDELNIVGYYKLDKKMPVKGLFAISYSDNTLSKPSYNDFDFNIIVQYKKLSKSKKQKLEDEFNKNNFGWYSLSIKSTIALNDGTILVIGEQGSANWRSSTGGATMINSGASTGSPANYITGSSVGTITGGSSVVMYSDIILSKLSIEDQKIEWNSKIPRYISSGLLYIRNSENNVFLIFPDNPKNASITDNLEPEDDKILLTQSLCAYKVDLTNGEKERYQLTNKDKVNGQSFKNTVRMALLDNEQIMIELDYPKNKFGYFKAEL